jgi:putative nucleotidyltransferase with HDIG domain
MSSHAATGVTRGWAVHRSVTLLRVFLLASAVILISGGVLLGSVLTSALRAQALNDKRTSFTQYVDGVLRPQLVRNDRIRVAPHLPGQIMEELRRQPDIVSVKVWRPDGVLVWTIGAYEIYAKPQQTEAFIASRKRLIWFAILAVFIALYGALALLVRNASSTLQRQATTLQVRSRELMDSYRRLEESSLEAIESLNATVDAKDPYTAGHSARVQRIALAVAEELGVPAERLDAVRFGGLFHDIGKIAVPDSILTKPAALDDDEYAVVQRHPADGAEIVSHFSRLHEAVPLIRHHHERWDGTGYPDRLAGEQIPLEACVVGLADAWDAMTTDRPYRASMPVDEAVAEVHRCRGTQFAPVVVDAFFAAFRRRPAVFEPDEPKYGVAATA